jgi:MtrB/PioB family decaheme-associated outer membrane protein
MKTNNTRRNIIALAVQSALLAMFSLPMIAEAEGVVDEDAAALTHPTNSVEFGVSNVSKDSAKFGEYNGQDKSGAYGIANINLRGGSAYDDSDSVMRWQIKATDLGTTSREVGASVSNQGKWSIGVNFDELRHNLSDSYQTPYQGSMGGNSFTLPTGFSTINTGTGLGTNSMTSAQQLALHNVDIHTTRENSSITLGYTFDPHWDVKLDINHLEQSGAKLMAFAATPITGVLGTAFSTSAMRVIGETISILPNPTNYKTDTVNLALNWTGDKAHISTSYFGSYFRNAYDRVTFETFASATLGNTAIQTMSSAPDNDFHQLNLTGGYTFTPKTKLAGGVSYGRNTQNDAYAYDAGMMVAGGLPKSSLNGVVVTTHADIKLTDQTIKNLTLSAGFKYDERDNQTTSSIYNFYAVDGSHASNYPSTPLSNRKTQYELTGDYRLTSNQHVRLAYNRENVERWCDNFAVSSGYPAGNSCVVATASRDDKLSATYKLNATEDVKLNVGYSYSDRTTDSNPLARTAIIGTAGGTTLINGVLTAGTIKGLNSGDFLGFYPFFDATRNQQMAKAGIDWQANEKLSMGLNGRYTYDNYYDSTYGVQNGNSWSLNVDTSYNYNENGSITAYLTKEHRERGMTNLQKIGIVSNTSATAVASPQTNGAWSFNNNLNDNDITFGLGAKQGGLLTGKLQLAGDITYSLAKTGYDTQLNYTGVTNAGLSCSAPTVGECGSVPNINNRLIRVKINGDYKVNKSSKVALGYIYQHLNSNDYFYSGYQYGSTPTAVLPTNQQSGSYSVSVVSATYIYNF